MYHTKLFKLYKSLTKKEIRNLHHFVRSSYYKKREDVIRLLDTLRSTDLETIQEDFLFKQVFPRKQPPIEASEKKKILAKTMNYLVKKIEIFFAIELYQKEQVRQQLHIAQSAIAHAQQGLFIQKIKKGKDLLAVNRKSLESALLHYELERSVYENKSVKKRDTSINLETSGNYLDTYVMGMQLKHACLKLAHQRVSEIKYEYDFFNCIYQYIDQQFQNGLLRDSLTILYYHAYKMIKEESEEAFQIINNTLKEDTSQYAKSELSDFYSFAINFSIYKINRGENRYIQDAFELYRCALSEGLLINNGIISPFNYKHIVGLGLVLDKKDWVKQFLQDYKPFLEITDRENNFSYNLAKLKYKENDYSSAMRLLHIVDFKDNLQNLTSKILLLKIYYELEEDRALMSYLNSYKQQVSRKLSLLPNKKEAYLNFISCMKQLNKIIPNDKKSIEKLKNKILSLDKLPEKKWLLNQLQKL